MKHGQHLTRTSSKTLSANSDRQPGGASTRPMELKLSHSKLALMISRQKFDRPLDSGSECFQEEITAQGY